MGDYEVKKVLERKDGVKVVIIPKSFSVKKGDYVIIQKVNAEEVKND